MVPIKNVGPLLFHVYVVLVNPPLFQPFAEKAFAFSAIFCIPGG